MKEESIPEFENGDHAIIWNSLTQNSTAIEQNSLAIEGLKTDMKWVKRELSGIVIPLIIAVLIAVIGLGV